MTLTRLIMLLFVSSCVCWSTDVSTAQMDNGRSSYNSAETALTPVSLSSLAMVGKYNVDGAVYAQTLVISSVPLCASISLFVVTMHGSAYCFDASVPASAYKWTTTLVAPLTSFITSSSFFYGKEVGCLSTPVVDAANNRIYTSCHNSAGNIILTVLNASNGTVVGSPVTISGQVVGTGCVATTPADTTSGANLIFYPAYELQRAPLTLVGSTLMVAFAAWDDKQPWHGWVMTYDVSGSTPSQIHVWCSTPTGCGGGIWQAGGGVSNDGTSYYFATGNGDYDGSVNYGMSILKLSATLTISDWFTPTNYATLNSEDADFSSGRVMIIPGGSYVTFGSKDFYVRLIGTSSMGHLAASPTQQFLTNPSPPTPASGTGIYGGAFANGRGFFPNVNGPIYAFSYSAGSYNTSAVTTSASFAQTQGMTISSNAGSNEILWAITNASGAYSSAQAGVLRAYNPATMAEYWDSGTTLGYLTKFHVPTVVNGSIFVGNLNGQVLVWSLAPATSFSGGGSLQ